MPWTRPGRERRQSRAWRGDASTDELRPVSDIVRRWHQFGPAFQFPRTDGVTGYHDIRPRMGGAYDLFGNGETAIKISMSKYLQAPIQAKPKPSPTPPSRSSRASHAAGPIRITTSSLTATILILPVMASAWDGAT